MNQDDKSRFGQLITALAANWRKEFDRANITIYWLGLKDLTFDQVQDAIALALRESKFMPSVAELREFVLGGASNRIQNAWLLLNRTMDTQGPYKSVDFEDKVINAAVRSLGGWVSLFDWKQAEWDRFAFARFEKAYRAFASRPVGIESGARLIGLVEQRNSFQGHSLVSDSPNVYLGAPVAICADYPIGIEHKPDNPDVARIVHRTHATEITGVGK